MATWKQLLGLAPATLVLACGGGGVGGGTSASPMASSPQAVSAFFRAAADSNLTRMAELWGTASGPVKQPMSEDTHKRIALLQAWLKADSTRVISDEPVAGDANRRRHTVAIWRSGCSKQIPVATVRTSNGWIVSNVEVAYAGNPARPCEPATP